MTDKTMLDILWVLICSALVFTMQAGFLCLEAGMSRAKNSINIAVKNIMDFGLAVLLFWAVGFAWMFGDSIGGWIGGTEFFLALRFEAPWKSTFFLFQLMFCATSVTIISGAVAERIKFEGYLVTVILVAGFIYPIFGHWAWASGNGISVGWLEKMGFVDFAGATVVHSIGGWAALALLLIVGARSGRFQNKESKIQGSNLAFSMLGVMLLWFGWFGFNGGSMLGFTKDVPGIIANTVLASGAGLVTAIGLSYLFCRYVNVEKAICGPLAGLVAITAGCHSVAAEEAVLIGAVGAVVMELCAAALEKMRIDDAVQAIPVHLAAGIWGTAAVALFGDPAILGTGLSFFEQLKVQAIGIAAASGIGFVVPMFVFFAAHKIVPLRVTQKEEELGLNVSEHRAGTEILNLLQVMEKQAREKSLTNRAKVEPFTEVGIIAKYYNQVMDALEKVVGETKAVIDVSRDAILSFSEKDFLIVAANAAAERMFGIETDRLVGKSFLEMVEAENGFDELSAEQKIQGMLVQDVVRGKGRRLAGDLFPAEISVIKVENAAGSFYTATIKDITNQARAQKDLNDRARSLDEAKKAMLNILEDLQREKADRQLILDTTGEGLYGLDLEGKTTFVNPAALKMLGFENEEDLIGKFQHTLIHHSHRDGSPYDKEKCPIHAALTTGKTQRVVNEIFWRKDGKNFPVEYISTPIRKNGKITGAVVSFSDISERKRLEEQFQQAQKMEGFGRLAGGVAHDFNNLLTVIRGYCERIMSKMNREDMNYSRVSEISKAADRAVALTGQLLAFSRRQVVNPEVLDLNEVISNAEKMLKPLIGETIDLEIKTKKDLWPVKIDPGQIDQVIMNLVVNARDAMRRGGKIDIDLGNVEVFENDTRTLDLNLKPGKYVKLSVRDDGEGMSDEIKKHIFEPFFTTKEKGKGTGLGLATCFGIIKQNKGEFEIISELGKGTTMSIYLPKSENPFKKPSEQAIVEMPEKGSGTILLTEDESAVRKMLAAALKEAGYEVIEAANGAEALDLYKQNKHKNIDVLLTDMIMPKLGGRELVEEIRKQRPDIKAIVMSGYTEDAGIQKMISNGEAEFLQKPFSQKILFLKLGEIFSEKKSKVA